MKKTLAAVSVMTLLLLIATTAARAEDVKGKIYIGTNLGILVTTDNIRSNAALIIAPLGRDGAPFTGDKGEQISCNSADPNVAASASVFCDPRPDDLLSRETMLQQTYKLDASVGYGLTSNFSVQLDTGYYKGEVSNFDVFTDKIVPFSSNPLDPCLATGAKQACALTFGRHTQLKQPIKAGSVTEMPVMLNGIVRFRKDSNFNPYIGAGLGYLFTGLTESPQVTALNARLESLHLITLTDELGPSFGRSLTTPDSDGNAIFGHAASVSINQGFQWQVVGGGEYFYNDRFSLVFDAKYVVSGEAIKILMNGEDQIDATAFTEDMFRKDGSLRIFVDRNAPPNPIIDPNNPGIRYTCNLQTNPPPRNYDGDSHADDACYGGSGFVPPKETVVVQGGRIRLSNFSFGFGVRFHF